MQDEYTARIFRLQYHPSYEKRLGTPALKCNLMIPPLVSEKAPCLLTPVTNTDRADQTSPAPLPTFPFGDVRNMHRSTLARLC